MDPLQDPLDDLDGGVGVFGNNIREAKVMMSLTRRPNSEMDDGRDNRQACKKSLTHWESECSRTECSFRVTRFKSV
jgi:hypothetical protein